MYDNWKTTEPDTLTGWEREHEYRAYDSCTLRHLPGEVSRQLLCLARATNHTPMFAVRRSDGDWYPCDRECVGSVHVVIK